MRRLSLVFLATLIFATSAAAQAPSRGTHPRIADPAWLREYLEKIRTHYQMPALSAAVVVNGQVAAASAVGIRKIGSPGRVTREDGFQIGSIAKTMTATLAGLLVDEGKLRWDMTMAEMFPELVSSMQPAYRKVTIVQLLAHTSGMPYTPSVDEEQRGEAGRYEYVRNAIKDKPEAPPGTKSIYSGGGIIVACAAERVTGRRFEDLIRDRLFRPLHMNRSGFGSAAHPGKVDGPWEHEIRDGKLTPVEMPPSYEDEPRSCVGRNSYCSSIDLAEFAAMHLRGAHGHARFLRPETFKRLHTVVLDGMGPGWGVDEDGNLSHTGSNGRNISECIVNPRQHYAVCVLTNANAPGFGEAVHMAVGFIEARAARGEVTHDRVKPLAGNGPIPPRPDVPLGKLKTLKATTGFGEVRSGKNAVGNPLSLSGDFFEDGMGVHAPSTLIYRHAPRFRRFVARVGIDAQQGAHGTVIVRVFAGDQLLHESPLLRGGDPPWNIDVAIPAPDAGRIRLVVDDGGDGSDWDLTDWVEAGFKTSP